MNRSKIFLGATACLLGIAAFAASKFRNPSQANYKTPFACLPYGNTPLNATTENPGSEATMLGTVVICGQIFQYPLYTASLGAVCLHPLFLGGM